MPDPMIDVIFLIWFWILPIIGMFFIVFAPIFWFIIVPGVARRLTGARFGNKTVSILGDDEGYIEVVVSKIRYPAGVVKTKRGYRFLPRPHKLKSGVEDVPDWMFKKYILRGLGKPCWFGYAGKVPNFNPPTGAVFSGSEVNPGFNPGVPIDVTELLGLINILPKKDVPAKLLSELKEQIVPSDPKKPLDIGEFEKLVIRLPKKIPKELTSRIKEIIEEIKTSLEDQTKALQNIDVTKMKGACPKLWTPSQIEEVGMQRELIGMKKAGKQIGKYVLGIGVLMILMVLCIVVVLVVSGGGMFGGEESGLISTWSSLISSIPT